MFNVKHNECVGFESRWKVVKVASQTSTQTTEFATMEIATNTTPQQSIETQTLTENNRKEPTVDDEHLANWLKRIVPIVEIELSQAINSKAFRGYQLLSDSNEAYCKLLQTITITDDNCNISTLSWNCTGKTLAISYNYNHFSWCNHDGSINIYPLTRDDLLADEPQLKLQTESCITASIFHPNVPNIIAAGTFGGDIIVWNLENGEDEIVVKIIGHNDNITHLLWINDINNDRSINLASSSLDNFLKVWDFNTKTATLKLKAQYMIKAPVPSALSNAFDDETSEANEQIGKAIRSIICFDFSQFQSDMFVVGAEGGLVVQCSLLGATELRKSTKETVPIYDPVYKYYVSHKSEINSIKFSPNRREMFLTNGTDGEIRVYLIDQEEPAQVIFPQTPLNTVVWVPFEERIITGCGSRNCIEIFDLIEAKTIENTTMEKLRRGVLTQMSINLKKTNFVAVGGNNGKVQLWKVPWSQFGNL